MYKAEISQFRYRREYKSLYPDKSQKKNGLQKELNIITIIRKETNNHNIPFKGYLLSNYYIPGIVLNTFYIISHLILMKFSQISIILQILQLKELKFKRLNNLFSITQYLMSLCGDIKHQKILQPAVEEWFNLKASL